LLAKKQPDAIEKIGAPAVGPLIKILDYPSYRKQAAEVLTRITGNPFTENFMEWKMWWEANRAKYPGQK
jgi:hypothetical protein